MILPRPYLIELLGESTMSFWGLRGDFEGEGAKIQDLGATGAAPEILEKHYVLIKADPANIHEQKITNNSISCAFNIRPPRFVGEA